MARRRRPGALDRRLLGDLRAPAQLSDARHQLHQLSQREGRGQPLLFGDPLLLRAQPVRSRRRRARRRRPGAAAAGGDPARARRRDGRAVRRRHARRRALQRVFRQVRFPAAARARRRGARRGQRHVRGAAARGLLPATGEVLAWIEGTDPFPPVEQALKNPNGLLAAGGDLSVPRLLEAYRHGVFPWYSAAEPILWWSPDPRMVLHCDELKVSRSLAKNARNKGYEVRVDTAFERVLAGCADRQEGTWLGRAMRAAYLALHQAGYAHCFETWRGPDLVGGLYGVALGRMFYGESMFSRATDASKVALVALVQELKGRGFPLIDCQMHTPLLASLGGREIPRRAFLRALAPLVNYSEPTGNWTRVAT